MRLSIDETNFIVAILSFMIIYTVFALVLIVLKLFFMSFLTLKGKTRLALQASKVKMFNILTDRISI
jgi:hypothetical protein